MSVLCVAQHEPHSARHMQVRRHRSASNAYPALLISDFATVMKWLGLAASTAPTLEMPVMACSWICAGLEVHENFHIIGDNACTLYIPLVKLSDQDEQTSPRQHPSVLEALLMRRMLGLSGVSGSGSSARPRIPV